MFKNTLDYYKSEILSPTFRKTTYLYRQAKNKILSNTYYTSYYKFFTTFTLLDRIFIRNNYISKFSLMMETA